MFRLSKRATRRKSLPVQATLKSALKQPKTIDIRRKSMPARIQIDFTDSPGLVHDSPDSPASPSNAGTHDLDWSPILPDSPYSAGVQNLDWLTTPTRPVPNLIPINQVNASTPKSPIARTAILPKGTTTKIILSHVSDSDRKSKRLSYIDETLAHEPNFGMLHISSSSEDAEENNNRSNAVETDQSNALVDEEGEDFGKLHISGSSESVEENEQSNAEDAGQSDTLVGKRDEEDAVQTMPSRLAGLNSMVNPFQRTTPGSAYHGRRRSQN